MGRYIGMKKDKSEPTRLFDRIAVAFFAGFTSIILLTLIWALLAWEFDIDLIPYWMVIAISVVMAMIGFLSHTNLIARMLASMMSLLGGLIDE
jgi:hypothetical protein